MRTYVIDDLRPQELEKITERLEIMGLSSGVEGLYWLPVPQRYLAPLQLDHLESCGPYALALELAPDGLRLELLTRARNRLRCECVAWAGPDLVMHMTGYLDGLLSDLGISH